MSSRTGPVSPEPDPSKQITPKTQREQQQRVEKVREVDPDEQTRKRFQKAMEDVDNDQDTTPRSPSPFETQFYSDDAPAKSVPDASDGAVPSPQYSPPPKLSSGGVPEPETADELPQSSGFWKGVGLPDQPVETPKVQPKSGGVSVPGKEVKKTGASKPDEKVTPTARYWEMEPQAPEQRIRSTESSDKKDAKDKKGPTQAPRDVRGLTPDRQPAPFDERRQQKDSSEPLAIQPPSMTPMPPDIQTQALAMTTPASPYLSPETLPLFYQMVGSILVMMSQPKGVSRTEVILNSPSFARSKFYGARIEIVRYASAPDSFNIRLSGSDQAVTAFHQAIPGLMTAFNQGNFQFRIGRIEAEYTAERPVFRRKDERGRGTSSGGGDMGDKR